MRKTVDTATPRTVVALICHAHVEMALSCLGSLLQCSAEPLRLRLHDDGTLTSEDCGRLAEGLAGLELVPREEADALVEETLAGRPALLAFRRDNPLALKLLDAPLLSAGGELAYCDSDILFLRPFSGLFRFPGPETGAVFMSDRQSAYSVRSWHLLRDRRLALPCRVNTGIVLFRTRFFDPDLLEWYLTRPEFRFAPVWAEQTAWALLGARSGCRLWDPRLIRLPRSEEESQGAVALHFVSPLRHLLPRFLERVERARGSTGEPPVPIGTVPAQRCRFWNLAWTEARRRSGRKRAP
jgi:hypothetical protein